MNYVLIMNFSLFGCERSNFVLITNFLNIKAMCHVLAFVLFNYEHCNQELCTI